MEFRGMESLVIDVLDTPEIQRLRRIRQLGLAHLVFPGAEHSRLVHCLGAAFLAIQFTRRLQEASRNRLAADLVPGDAAIRDVAIATLCHDMGHGALSHAWEREVIGDHYDVDAWLTAFGLQGEKEQLQGLKWHELVGQALLAWPDGCLHRFLERYERGFTERIRRLLRGEYYLPYLPHLLHGDIDVDRADFLIRDAQQCGVAHGRYDLDWLISTCLVGESSDKRLVAGFDKRKALRAVEQFLVARRALYETVYYHKAVHCAEGMVALFLRRMKEVIHEAKGMEVAPFIRPVFDMIGGKVVGQAELLSLDDYSLWVLIEHIAKAEGIDVTARDLAQRIIGRDLLKVVPCPSAKVSAFLREKRGYERIYNVIAQVCEGEPEYYLLVDTVKFRMLADRPGDWSYFVDGQMRATPIREHESLRLHWRDTEESIRLFTVQEAVEGVAALIGR
jgi:HD superfamily phosphohydrolase